MPLKISGIFLFILLSLSCRSPETTLLFLNVQPAEQELILSSCQMHLQDPDREIHIKPFNNRQELLNYLEEGNPADLLFYNDAGALAPLSPNLADLPVDTGSPMPGSMQDLGIYRQQKLAYPLQLDHIELALNKSRFQGENMSLDLLEKTLAEEASNRFFPLVVAGGEEEGLLDFIFLLHVSLGGSPSLTALCNAIESGESFDQIMEDEEGKTLNTVLELLIRWRKAGILHPEWYRFTYQDRTDFIEEGLSGAMIIRLSEHRMLPQRLISPFEAYPFPHKGSVSLSADIYTPPLMVSLLSESSRKEEMKKLMFSLLDRDFQKELCFFSGLAPVHSTVETLDKQASDLRFFAAASRSIAVESPILNEESPYKAFLKDLRSYLIANK